MSTEKQNLKLNIGGTVFQTTKSTLTKFDGMFKVMMETAIPVKLCLVSKDESSAIFIDRSPKHFDLILNFMRDGDVDLPDSEKEVKEIQREAHFYLLTDLIDLCDSKLPVKLTEVQSRLRFIDNNKDLFRIITKPVKHVLIFSYGAFCNDKVEYPRDFDITDIIENYGEHIDVYLRPITVNHKDEFYSGNWNWILYKKDSVETVTSYGSYNFSVVDLDKKITELLQNEARS